MNVIASYAVGVVGTVVLMVAWGLVQSAWRRSFPGPEDDALAARGGGCAGCACANPCPRRIERDHLIEPSPAGDDVSGALTPESGEASP